MKRRNSNAFSQLLMAGAVVSVLLAGIGYVGVDIWLASTQWLLVAAVLSLFGVYLRVDK